MGHDGAMGRRIVYIPKGTFVPTKEASEDTFVNSDTLEKLSHKEVVSALLKVGSTIAKDFHEKKHEGVPKLEKFINETGFPTSLGAKNYFIFLQITAKVDQSFQF